MGCDIMSAFRTMALLLRLCVYMNNNVNTAPHEQGPFAQQVLKKKVHASMLSWQEEDFRLEDKGSMWHCFQQVIYLVVDNSFLKRDDSMLRLFADTRDIANKLMQHPNPCSRQHEVTLQAGRYNADESLSEYCGGYPQREQLVLLMLRWLLPGDNGFFPAMERRLDSLARKHGAIPFDEEMEKVLARNHDMLPEYKQEQQAVPPGLTELFTKDWKRKTVPEYEKLKNALEKMRKANRNKNGYAFMEMVLLKLGIIKDKNHPEFLQALQEWGILDIDYKSALNSTKNKYSESDWDKKDKNYDTWEMCLDKRKLQHMEEVFRSALQD